MASLALAASIIILFTILIGPFTYILTNIGCAKIIVYIFCVICFFAGINLCLLPIPVWYIGLIPIYFGYTSLVRLGKKEN